jgi:hypothetical protein
LIKQVKEHAAAFWERTTMVSAVDPNNEGGNRFQRGKGGILLYPTPCSVTYRGDGGSALTKPALIYRHKLDLPKEAAHNAIISIHQITHARAA